MHQLLNLFWIFIKINLLTTSGPASVGLLFKEAVGKLIGESEFVEAVGFSSILPGSDALQLAMFVGYAAGGTPGALAALLGSILPPTLIMLGLAAVLQKLRGEAWIGNFVTGLTPAVAVLMVVVAWNVFQGDGSKIGTTTLAIAAVSLIALLLKAPPPLVLLGAGILGVILYR